MKGWILVNKKRMACLTAFENGAEDTIKRIKDLDKQGIDYIELMVPFSDPVAESPEIQKASKKALENGCTIEKVFNLLESIKDDIVSHIVLSFYANTAFKYGYERFSKRAKEVGISGFIVEDLPFEEREELKSVSDKEDIFFVTVLAKASDERLKTLIEAADGIICISPTFRMATSPEEFERAKKYILGLSTVPVLADEKMDCNNRYLVEI